ncbi:MAG: LysR family transcriptional regulator [Arenicella sp.]|nr:LysR family transcriptional regulator [Arenicella sp.]
MNNLSRVQMFVEVAKQESFVAAARILGVTGPAVSKQVLALENSLGVKLLYRTTRKVSLTEEGALYFDRARKAIDDLAEAEQQIQELKHCPAGKLKINAPMSFGEQYLARPIAKFAGMYPDVELDVSFDDRWVDVVGEGFDVVIRIGALADSSLIAVKLAPCPVILCASPDCIAKNGLPQTVNDIVNFPAVIYTRHGQTEDWRYIDSYGESGSVKLNKRFSGNSAEMQVAACEAGIGLALLPSFAIWSQLQSGKLLQLLPEYQTDPERNIYAMFPQNRHLSTRVRLFIDFLSELGKSFPWR